VIYRRHHPEIICEAAVSQNKNVSAKIKIN